MLALRVRMAIEHELIRLGHPNIDTVSRALSTSPRTLQRRLLAEGTTFRHVIDHVRAHMARRYLEDGGLGLDVVAVRLGYAEVSAFLRAFKRWTGMTPTQFRRVA